MEKILVPAFSFFSHNVFSSFLSHCHQKWRFCCIGFKNVQRIILLLYCMFVFLLADYNNISKFLNRILGMEVVLQNALFQYFAKTLEAVILEAKRSGRWDMGILGKKISRIVDESN